MDFNFTNGIRLVVELHSTEIVEGDYESGNKDRIDLVNVSEYPSGPKIKGMLSYYRCEIKGVHLLKNKGENITSISPPEVSPVRDASKVIGVPKAEYERLKQLTQNYIYMATVDSRYLNAVDHLKSCENVGVVGLGSELGRTARLSVLVLSSWDQVYIFDILSFRQKLFLPELKEILESEFIKKVSHDSRSLVDCLYHCHEVEMKNVFDTQIADVMILKDGNGELPANTRCLGECLTHYLNFPGRLLENAQDMTLNKWSERPLTPSRQCKAALLVAYLITLKNKLETIMLKDFYNVVNSYIGSLKDSTAVQAHMNLNNCKVPEDVVGLLMHREL